MRLGADRLLKEINLLQHERIILRRLRHHRRGGFFSVIQLAVNANHVIRLGRILDQDTSAFSLWTLLQWKPADVQEALLRHGVRIKPLREFSNRVRLLRSKVFAHNDSTALFDRGAVYKEANVKHSEIDRIAVAILGALRHIYRPLFGGDPKPLATLPAEEFNRIYVEGRKRGVSDGPTQ
jgi:hypothetical protein